MAAVCGTTSCGATHHAGFGWPGSFAPEFGHVLLEWLATSFGWLSPCWGFMNHAAQARFDLTKDAQCALCGVPDDNLHWRDCPRFGHLRFALGNCQAHHVMDTMALKHHLLPSRSPFAWLGRRR